MSPKVGTVSVRCPPGPSTTNDGVRSNPSCSASALVRVELRRSSGSQPRSRFQLRDVGDAGALGDRAQEGVGDVAGVLGALVAVEELDEVPVAPLLGGRERGLGGRRCVDCGADDRELAELVAARSPCARPGRSARARPGSRSRLQTGHWRSPYSTTVTFAFGSPSTVPCWGIPLKLLLDRGRRPRGCRCPADPPPDWLTTIRTAIDADRRGRRRRSVLIMRRRRSGLLVGLRAALGLQLLLLFLRLASRTRARASRA